MKGNLFLRFTAFVWTLILLVPVNQAAASASSWGLSSLFGGPEAVEPTGDKKWSSMLDVDPSKIISLMTRYGGLLIPKSAEKDVEVFSKVCHAESVKLNVIQRKLLVENFTVRLPGKEDALKIGRLFLRWDSYRKPCIEIEVDDVAITVEFLNVMLTKNNWYVLSTTACRTFQSKICDGLPFYLFALLLGMISRKRVSLRNFLRKIQRRRAPLLQVSFVLAALTCLVPSLLISNLNLSKKILPLSSGTWMRLMCSIRRSANCQRKTKPNLEEQDAPLMNSMLSFKLTLEESWESSSRLRWWTCHRGARV
jgi:hypothetical protein